MKNCLMTSCARNRERGSVAIMIAFMWTTLFGMAVVAVDFGYLYTQRRGIQAAADAAVTAGMPILAGPTHDQSAAMARAHLIANQNNFPDTDIVTNTATASQLTVTLKHTYPTFFGSVLGMTPKTIQATSVGKINTPGTAIHSNDAAAGCSAQWAWGAGVQVTGAGKLVINGDVEARDKVELQSTDATCTPATCLVTGTAKSPCNIYDDSPATFGIANTSSVATPDPLAGNTLATLNAFCTNGTTTATAMAPGAMVWTVGALGDTLAPGVYCSSTNITVSPTGPSGALCLTGVTLISAGTVGITGNGAITLSAAAGVPNNIAVYSDFVGAGPAIQMANGITGQYTVTGAVYAPHGLVNIGTGTPGFTMTGALVGDTVQIAMGPGQPWTFNAPGAGPAGWHLYQ